MTIGTTSDTALLVRSGSRNAAIPLGYVIEIVPACEVSPAPGLPEHVAGVLNYHGTVLPVVDLARVLLEPASRLNPRQRFIICSCGKGRVVLLTDQVGEMVNIGQEQLLDIGVPGSASIRFAIVSGEAIPILDPETIFVEHDSSIESLLRSPEQLLIQD